MDNKKLNMKKDAVIICSKKLFSFVEQFLKNYSKSDLTFEFEFVPGNLVTVVAQTSDIEKLFELEGLAIRLSYYLFQQRVGGAVFQISPEVREKLRENYSLLQIVQ